ncbi:MAG: hypothetical protein M1829_003444 [Trizodia sp. TS-e1964]|nr:MAG: hypothetical protein M1829_003444 [Trizodia sp. TS-e1964]
MADVVSGVFYLLGRMAICIKDSRSQLLDYHVLVSLIDHSVWIQYCAWDSRFIFDNSGPEDEWGEREPCSPFKPDDDPDWARLHGMGPRVLMAMIAKDVRTWSFSEKRLALSEIWSDDLVVPAISFAAINSLGAVIPGF